MFTSGRYKKDRMWNINANIIAADLAGTAITALIIESIHSKFNSQRNLVLSTALIDGSISLLLFGLLHLNANRDRGVKDLVRVQLHRWALTPLNYLVGGSLQFALLAVGVRPSIGVLVAYISALAVVRTVHTIYGKRSGLFQ
jgi:hypothetical protein